MVASPSLARASPRPVWTGRPRERRSRHLELQCARGATSRQRRKRATEQSATCQSVQMDVEARERGGATTIGGSEAEVLVV